MIYSVVAFEFDLDLPSSDYFIKFIQFIIILIPFIITKNI